MTVADIMTDAVRVCAVDAPLSVAARMMWEGDCGSVVVVDDGGRVVSVITDRDICMAAYTQDKPLSSLSVSGAMSGKLCTVNATDPLDRAREIMRNEQIRRLPVVAEGGRLVGILSLRDLALAAKRPAKRVVKKAVTAAAVGETLAGICACVSGGGTVVQERHQ